MCHGNICLCLNVYFVVCFSVGAEFLSNIPQVKVQIYIQHTIECIVVAVTLMSAYFCFLSHMIATHSHEIQPAFLFIYLFFFCHEIFLLQFVSCLCSAHAFLLHVYVCVCEFRQSRR